MTSDQETEASNNEEKHEIRDNVSDSKNEKKEVCVVGSVDGAKDHGNGRDEKLGGMDMLVLVCSEESDKIDGKKGKGTVCVDQESIDGDGANVDEARVDGFMVGDLVWGKIKNYPSWPGLIYDPSDASDTANQSKKVNKLLVAYFGDGTYNWCSQSQLVPFVDHYEKMSRQSSLEEFVNAVQEAVEELGRRIERTMICSCVPEENLSGLARPEAINAGVRSGVLLPDGAIGKLPSLWCEPAKLLEYARNVEQTFPMSNLLQFELMKRMLSSFSRVRRGFCLPIYQEPQLIEGLEHKSENDFSVPIKVPIQLHSSEESSGSPKMLPMTGLMLTSTQKTKQKSVSKIMGEGTIDKLKGKKRATTAICKKTASNDDVNKRGTLQASTATRIRRRKKIDNSVSGTTMVNDGIPNNVNEISRLIKRMLDEDTGHDSANAKGNQQSSAAGRKRRKRKTDVRLERVENESTSSSELKKYEEPDDDDETSNYKLHNDQKSGKKWKSSTREKRDIGSENNSSDLVPAQPVTQSEKTDKPRSRVTQVKKAARAAGTNKMEVDIPSPDSSDASGAIESGKTTSISHRKIPLKNPVCLQPISDDVSQVDTLRQNVASMKSMLMQCDGEISSEEKASLECEIRSLLEMVGELVVKASS